MSDQDTWPEADEPAKKSGNAIQSDVLLTVVHTRAHILSVMANPRLSPLAKNVACVLWAITETWSGGEERAVTMPQIAEAITYSVARDGDTAEVHPDAKRVGEALKALEDEGYVHVRRPQWGKKGVGRGSATGVRMIRRTLADPHTHGEKVFRSWTQNLLDQSPEIVAAVKRKGGRATPPSKAKKKGGRMTPPSQEGGANDPTFTKEGGANDPTFGDKGGRMTPPSGQEGGANDPLQRVDLVHQVDRGDEFDLCESRPSDDDIIRPTSSPDLRPPFGAGSGPLPGADSATTVEEQAESTSRVGISSSVAQWGELRTATDVVNCLYATLNPVGQDLFTRDRRLEAIGCLDRFAAEVDISGRSMLYMLSVWAGETNCAYANKVTQYIARYRREFDLSAALEGLDDPTLIVAAGLQHGYEDELTRARQRKARAKAGQDAIF